MIEQPDVDSYSIPARICLFVAVGGGAVLVALTVASLYFIR
ncbi:hypothetical protein [Bradyrhizobium guangdongense]|nr:hypothetical protein [Bradyrhizobium guangdongense]